MACDGSELKAEKKKKHQICCFQKFHPVNVRSQSVTVFRRKSDFVLTALTAPLFESTVAAGIVVRRIAGPDWLSDKHDETLKQRRTSCWESRRNIPTLPRHICMHVNM